MSEYVVLHLTPAYEVGLRDDQLIGACVCGSSVYRPNKGLGRASVAAWRTRHEGCA